MKKIRGMFVLLMIITVIGNKTSILFATTPEMVEVAGVTNEMLTTSCKAAILMETSTGTVLYEKNPDEKLSPASITKIMTLLLIFEALEKEEIQYDDVVTTSEYAKSMGGSQVFLETGEQQTVETLIKCIVIASGNDASVAMAEYIAGTEEAFVKKMNEKAKALGMVNTYFKDCCGLWDDMEHYSTARDVAIMSRELLVRYPEIQNYSKIWMENITHVTDKGSKEFTLSNTNRLIKQYSGATGLKTGSTSLAKYCLSASAMRDGIELVAVIMAAPDYKARFKEATTLLDYGYASISMYKDEQPLPQTNVPVKNGTKAVVELEKRDDFRYICKNKQSASEIRRLINLPSSVKAPVKEGQQIGTVDYYIEEEKIGSVPLNAKFTVKEAGFMDYFKKIYCEYLI